MRKNLPASQLAMDNCLQKKLPLYNHFIAERFRHFSQDAYNQNKKALREFGIPSWSNEEWESYTQDPSPLASNFIVTSNNFSKKVHCDQDKNNFTYGIFSYINPSTGTPILPPQIIRGHSLRFPDYDCKINFGTIPGIIEVLWKSNDIAHHTTGPPPELRSSKSSTHFGCLFQISHCIVARAVGLKKLTKEERRKRTTNQEERSNKKAKKI